MIASLPASFRVNLAHIRRSRPDFGLGFQVEPLETCYVVLSSLGGSCTHCRHVSLLHWTLDLSAHTLRSGDLRILVYLMIDNSG
jgi:hypothetical protein